MRYILIDEQRKRNAKAALEHLPPNGKWCVEIKPYKKNRSAAQNRTMWMWYHVIAEHTGHTPEELHEYVKALVLGVEKKTILATEIIVPKSTTTLSPREMANFLNAVEALAKCAGVKLPYPDDYTYLTFQDEKDATNH